MSAIRARSPSEIALEKKLLNCRQALSGNTGPLFDFFKSQAKSMINYHLDKPKKAKKYSKENESDEEELTPPKYFKKKVQPKRASAVIECEPTDDYKKLRETVNKRAYVVETVLSLLTSQKKSLNTVKMTTNREHLVRQVEEIEDTNETITKELESLTLSLHESLRQVDKLSQVSSFEKSSLSKDLNVGFQETLNKERKKYEAQIKALQDAHKQISALPKAADVEREYQKKITDLTNKLEICSSSLEEKSENLKKRHSDYSELLKDLSGKNSEIESLEKEIINLQNLIRSTEEGFERENALLKTEITKLERMMKENTSNLEVNLKNEVALANSGLQAKEREIAKLKLDLNSVEEQLRRVNFELEGKQRNASELKDEIVRLHDLQRASTKSDSQEINYLRQALEEKENQLAGERERMAIEIETREKHRIKQKNEWAEIYAGLKHEIKELKQTVADMADDRRGISYRENEFSESQISLKSQVESLKSKIRDRDNEIRALWEIFAELQRAESTKGRIDFTDVKTLIIIKNLEEKAKQKLKKFLN
jgi:chromosome segregation ATPase